MAQWHYFVIAASVSVAACSYTSPPSAEAMGQPGASPSGFTAEQQRQVVSASRLWMENCAKCHGEGGEGGGGGTRSLLTKAGFDQKNDRPYFDAIENGVPHAGMDAYGETLSDEQMWALVVRIRELQSRALRAETGSPKPDANGVYRSQRHSFRVETVIEKGPGLRIPWAIDWLPDGRMLVTNKPGTMLVAPKAGLGEGTQGIMVEGLPASVDIGQGGLMDVAVHPNYARNGWIYLAFTDPAKSGERGGMTKVVRGKLRFQGNQARWADQQTIFELPQELYTGAGVHFGCRIVFDRAGHIFFSIGDRGQGPLVQDPSKPNGKIYRVNEDGTIPSDNPFVATRGALPAVWSYGHRNPQGLAFGLDGTLWDTEHAPRGGDEVNRIVKAANYGWPLVSFGINYNDSPFQTPWPTADQKITMPVFRWLPSTGACGLDIARGAAFPQWKGDLLAGGLVGQNLDRLRIAKDQVVEREELIHGMGRIRDVATAPDGTIYVVLNGPDKVVRLVPAR